MDQADGAGDGKDNKLEANDQEMVRNVLANSFNPTDLNVYYDSTPVWSGSSETDIYFEEDDVPNGSDGTTRCNDPDDPALSRYECDQHYITIR